MSIIYAGLTLGPVVRTLTLGRTPLEIRQASYIFSKISEIIVKELQNEENRKCFTIYSPDNIDPETNENTLGDAVDIGLYSDHIFFSFDGTPDKAKEALNQARNKALDFIAADMAAVTGKRKDECKTCLDGYVYTMTAFLSGDEYNTIPMHILSKELDLLELRAPLIENDDLMLEYLDNDKLAQNSKLFSDSGIPSTKELGIKAGKEKQCSDYIAIVQADGDSMGTLFSKLSMNEKIKGVQAVSRFLFEQGRKNAKTVKAYGGVPVYFGGDDMLFLAPLYGDIDGKTESLFKLIKKLSDDFDDTYKNYRTPNAADLGIDITPTLSFGVGIGYVRQPINEILSSARLALFDEAKKAKWADKLEKKAISIHLRKHSGQESHVLVSCHQKHPSIDKLVDLTDVHTDGETVHSIHWKVQDQRNILAWLLENAKDKREERIKAWFQNNFNEMAAANEAEADKLGERLCELMTTVYDARKQSADEFMKTIDGIFRLEEFLHLGNSDNSNNSNEGGRIQSETGV